MSENDTPPPAAPTIVIIDDDDATVTGLQTGLTQAGYLVQRAGTANEALATLEQTRADLILVSLMLPDTNGLILCATLKTQFPAPIILMTTRGGEVDRALALESGAVDVLPKPTHVDELLKRVRAVVSRGEGVGTSGVTSQGSFA